MIVSQLRRFMLEPICGKCCFGIMAKTELRISARTKGDWSREAQVFVFDYLIEPIGNLESCLIFT